MLHTAIIGALLLMLTACADEATTYTGTVTEVKDGDTLTLQVADEAIEVRLANIDAPENRQPYGLYARRALAEKVLNKTVTVEQKTTDKDGRVIGIVILDGRDINREMVAEGHAWVYRQYSKDESLLEVEAKAKAEKQGLWQFVDEEQRMPPWEWRTAKKRTFTIEGLGLPRIVSMQTQSQDKM